MHQWSVYKASDPGEIRDRSLVKIVHFGVLLHLLSGFLWPGRCIIDKDFFYVGENIVRWFPLFISVLTKFALSIIVLYNLLALTESVIGGIRDKGPVFVYCFSLVYVGWGCINICSTDRRIKVCWGKIKKFCLRM